MAPWASAAEPTAATGGLVGSLWRPAAGLAESLWRSDARRHWYCAGVYVVPPLPPVEDSDAIELTAGALESYIDAHATATGDVAVRQGDRLLRADTLAIDEPAALARVPGVAHLREPGLQARGRKAVVSLAGGSASLADAEFVLADLELRGHAARIHRNDATLQLSTATLTRCPPGKKTWQLGAKAIRIDQGEAFATARHVRLTLGSVPVFYLPYARFPISAERATGFLFPNIGYDGSDGLDVTLPYYLNLAPNYDATLTPRLIGARGTGLETEFRHKNGWSDNEIGGAFLAQDDDYDGELSRSDFLAEGGAESAFAPADRWLLTADHRARIGRLRTRLDYAAVSDNDYFLDLGSELAVNGQVSLERRGELEYARGGLLARLWAQGFQRLEPGLEPYRRLPEANIAYAGDLWGPLAWSLGAAWTSFRGRSHATGLAAAAGRRAHLEPRLRLLLSRSWGFLNLAAGSRHTRYDLALLPAGIEPRPKRDIQLASIDGGLFFERDFVRGEGIQTLEPRLYYLYQSYADQNDLPRFDAARLTFSYRQLFRDNRFAGLDRFGDANQISAGVTSRLLTVAGQERLAASVGAIAYLDHRRVALNGRPGSDERQRASALAGELRATLGNTRLVSTLAWDANDNDLDEVGFGISYRRGHRRVVNLGYRRRALAGIDQTDFSFHWPLAGPWSAFGRWNHDWRFGQMIEGFAGIGYASCCLEVKVLWHETIDASRNRLTPNLEADGGLQVQVVFRGLAGFGTKLDSRLERGIKGYRREEDSR